MTHVVTTCDGTVARLEEQDYMIDGMSPPLVGTRDVIFTFSTETFADARIREFCFTAGQALLAISRAKYKVRRIIAAEAWRSGPAPGLKTLASHSWKKAALDDVTLLKPLRIRRRDPEIVGALIHSDASIIPHIIKPPTCVMYLLKLYEYLAAGKPVAATDLPPIRSISERVIIAYRDDFPGPVFAALKLPSQMKDKQVECAR